MANTVPAALRHLGMRCSMPTWRAAMPSCRLSSSGTIAGLRAHSSSQNVAPQSIDEFDIDFNRPLGFGAIGTIAGLRAHSSLQNVVPQSIDEFDIDFNSPIGFGAIGTVYSGQHRTTAREVAIKAVPSVLTERHTIQCNLESGELSDSIAYETKAFTQMINAGFSNPHVVDCIACFEGPAEEAVMLGLELPDNAIEEPLHYFVMERLETTTLQDIIEKKQPINEQQACLIIRAACQGLLHLHANGIVHRDIKPGNIMLPEGDVIVAEVKLIDFSHAGVLEETTESLAVESGRKFTKKVGTPGYVAPEILMQKEPYSAKCDVYSLGATAHSLLSEGRLPRRHPRLGIVTSFPDSISEECLDLLNSLLSYSPDDRPTVAEILKHPWMAE